VRCLFLGGVRCKGSVVSHIVDGGRGHYNSTSLRYFLNRKSQEQMFEPCFDIGGGGKTGNCVGVLE